MAEHKDVQDCVRKEVDGIIKENQEKLTTKLQENLQCLERCIKKALRLYPSVYFISQITSKDAQLSSNIFCVVIILIFVLAKYKDQNYHDTKNKYVNIVLANLYGFCCDWNKFQTMRTKY